jgi:hypothetical protein
MGGAIEDFCNRQPSIGIYKLSLQINNVQLPQRFVYHQQIEDDPETLTDLH